MAAKEDKPLRTGWTTGACATAAVKAAYLALVTGEHPDTITITLPGGQTPTFEVVGLTLEGGAATAGIIKDAGDDPDVTHGALIKATVTKGPKGVTFKAGKGVGTVTKPGLPLPPGEPAINPVPRQMMEGVITELNQRYFQNAAGEGGVIIEISVPNGEKIAQKTWNGRLGILGGISILGTTGIVVPYSCSAWIHSIHRGIDVARAGNSTHIGAAVGNSSEKLIIARHGLEGTELIDMGDFVGGMLKYLKKNPVPNITIAGGFAKMSKLAFGAMDLHSKRTTVNKAALAALLKKAGANEGLISAASKANTALEILNLSTAANIPLASELAELCLKTVREKLDNPAIKVEILLTDRAGKLVGAARDKEFQGKNS